jgi:hypothetical protein
MPAFWLTINPSDIRSPLVLILAGVEYSEDIVSASNSAVCAATATSNPVAVATFFHYVCTAVFDGLLASGRNHTGILGDSNHYGVVETIGRGMLHLHAMVWLRGNLAFSTLRNGVLSDSKFAEGLIRYLENVIIQSVDESISNDPEMYLPATGPSACDPESDHEIHLDWRMIATWSLDLNKCTLKTTLPLASNTARMSGPATPVDLAYPEN